MSWYAEDVTRMMEREVHEIENLIRTVYPAAVYIELEPDSKYADIEALPDDIAFDSPGYTKEKAEMSKLDEEMSRYSR